MSENMFTQEQLDHAIQNAKNEWIDQELNPIITERDGLLQFKPKEKSESEIALETKQQELFTKEVLLELKSAGLEKFADIVKVSNSDELVTTIETLTSIVNEIKVENGYVPDNHKSTDAYNTAKSKGDTKGMIKSLLGLN